MSDLMRLAVSLFVVVLMASLALHAHPRAMRVLMPLLCISGAVYLLSLVWTLP